MITKNYDNNERANTPIITFNKDKTEITFDTKYIWLDEEGSLCIDMTKLPYGLKVKRQVTIQAVAKQIKIEMIKVDNEMKNNDN